MGASDGKVEKVVKIVDKGKDSECFNLALLAEGFKKTELKAFEGYCTDFVKKLQTTSPFKDCATKINVYRVDISSDESGADDPKACGGPGTTVDTYLDATFCADGQIRRLMGCNTSLATSVLSKQVKTWHRAIVIVNTKQYGGSGGTLAITSVSSGWLDVVMHELGHTFGLGDEYQSYYGCGNEKPQFDKYTGSEPTAPNSTAKTKRHEIKWRSLIAAKTPIPTLSSTSCSKCSYAANPQPAGTVGLYEGAEYCRCGAYRPAYRCMMRDLSDFCPVCQAAIRTKLAPFIKTHDLSITPWGYALNPKKTPYWQTPDIWGSPVRGQKKNDLHIRIANVGKASSPAYKVRVSYVPFTTSIDMKNEIVIKVASRPGLAAGGTDSFVVNWDLTPPALPTKYAKYEHFCVIAEIQLAECNTTNHKAQNNFCKVPVKPTSPPPPIEFEIGNPWEEDGLARLVFSTSQPRTIIEPLDFDPNELVLRPGERRNVRVRIEPMQPVDADGVEFEITQLLNDQVIGGISGRLEPRKRLRIVLGGVLFDRDLTLRAFTVSVPWGRLAEAAGYEESTVELHHVDDGLRMELHAKAEFEPDLARRILHEAGYEEGPELHLVVAETEGRSELPALELMEEALRASGFISRFTICAETETRGTLRALADAGLPAVLMD